MKKLVPRDAVLIPDDASSVFKGQIFEVYQWPQALFDGSAATFEMLKRPDTTTAVCIVDGKVLVLDEEQPNTGVRKSFPGGRVEPTDASVLEAAQREVLEETGYTFQNWRLIKVWQPHTKLEWFVYLFLAWDVLDSRPTAHEAGEKITLSKISFEQLKELVITKSGYLGDSTEIFETLHDMEALLALPAYEGVEVDR